MLRHTLCSARVAAVFTFVAWLFVWLWPASVCAQATVPSRITIHGTVVDSITGQRVEFITIQEKGKANGTISNTDGSFSLTVNSGATLQFSCVGYRAKELPAGRRGRSGLVVRICPTDYELSEVVVKPKREHYRRRDNPSVALARQVIAHKNDNSPLDSEYFSQERFDRMTYSFNNFNDGMQRAWRKKFPFIDRYIDTATLSGSPILPISTEEHVETHYFSLNPRQHKTVIEANRHAGLDDMMPNEIVQAMKTEVFPEVDLQDDNIYLFTNKFVSPLSSFAPTFYKFYILDTVRLDDGERYIDLGFAPLLAESFGFVGHLYVSTDTTYFLRRAELNVPRDINLNFVRNMRIVIDQDHLPDGTRVTLRKTFDSEMNIVEGTMGLYAHRTCAYSKFSFDAPPDSSILTHWGPVIERTGLAGRDTAYWSDYASTDGTSGGRSVADMMQDMRRVPFFYYGEQILTALFKGYISIGKKPYEENKFLYGPLNTTISYNAFEGVRLRAGGITTANLNKHLFGFGYVAYGCRDNEWKYNAEVEWSFKAKKMHANEFPIHSLRFSTSYDTRLLGQDPTTSKDNFLLSLRRSGDEQVSYQRRTAVLYTSEHWNGFSYKLNLEHTRDYSTRFTAFHRVGRELPDEYYDMSTATLTLRYAPGEKFMQSRTSRIPINKQAPVFLLTHSVARRGTLGSDFDYQRTDFKFSKRWWLSAFGYVDVNLKAGRVWSQSPFTMLCLPNANLAYTIQDESFSQMNAMEFVGDQYASWDIVYFLNGALFNNVPLFNRLKWREVVSFRGTTMRLSAQNDPAALTADGVLRNPELYRFPADGTVYKMDDTPYMELAVGIENIFKILRVDYIRRLTYLDHPDTRKNGVQVTMHLTF